MLPMTIHSIGFCRRSLGLLFWCVFCAVAHAQSQSKDPSLNPPITPVITVSKAINNNNNPSQQSSESLTPSISPSGPVGGAGIVSANGDYVLHPGDTIEMVVYREQDLGIRSKIGKDGLVQFPLLGEIRLGGLTVRSATSLIRQRYNADYLVEPQIYLNVSSYNPRRFTIIGQVVRPGTYEFAGSESLGLLEAVGMAGGFTRIADRGRILIKRRDGDLIHTMKVNAKKLSDGGLDRFELLPGDVINVGESWY